MIKTQQGSLIEYSLAAPPLSLIFEFNPQTISRTRRVTVQTGSSPATRGGYDFSSPTETPRASQGVSVDPESFTVKILLDATDRMNVGDPVATAAGIQPELDTIRTMMEPKSQSPGGVQTLASLGATQERAFSRHESASVLIFFWGIHILPVFLTNAQVDVKDYLPTLIPYRADATLTLQMIESNNLFYRLEAARQVMSAALNTGQTLASAIEGVIKSRRRADV